MQANKTSQFCNLGQIKSFNVFEKKPHTPAFEHCLQAA